MGRILSCCFSGPLLGKQSRGFLPLILCFYYISAGNILQQKGACTGAPASLNQQHPFSCTLIRR